MCTGLVGACVCRHYTPLRWTSRCDKNCDLPRGHVQRVPFQCTGCDACEQEILDVEVESEAGLGQVESIFARMRAEMQREQTVAEGAVWREWYMGSLKFPDRRKRELRMEQEFARLGEDLKHAQLLADNKIIMAEEEAIREIKKKWLEKLRKLRLAPEHR
jgi:hypothetical protein